MKYITLFIIGLSIMLFSQGCNNGPLTSGGAGFFPKIDQVQMVNINDPSNPILVSLFKTGDNICFNMQAEDNDQNMKTLWLSVYLADTETIISGPEAITLPKQDKENMVYTQIGSMKLTETTGEYRIDFEVEDETGNRSGVYALLLTVQ
jgi:hypothetical protein